MHKRWNFDQGAYTLQPSFTGAQEVRKAKLMPKAPSSVPDLVRYLVIFGLHGLSLFFPLPGVPYPLLKTVKNGRCRPDQAITSH